MVSGDATSAASYRRIITELVITCWPLVPSGPGEFLNLGRRHVRSENFTKCRFE